MKKRVLGKGLDAIIPRGPESRKEYEYLSVSRVSINPNQPRKKFDRETLSELVDSIREKGVIQPVLVRKIATGYELVAGERRLRAAKEAGVEKIPAVVKTITEAEALELAIIENVQREDLNPLEIAEAYTSLAREFGLSQEEISRKVGKDRTTVTNYMRLLKLPKELREGLVEGLISFGHARALLAVSSDQVKKEVYEKIVARGLSVRETEILTRDRSGKGNIRHKTTKKSIMSVELRSILDRLQRVLGAKVRLRGSEKKGVLEIHYSSPEELDGIINKLK